MNKTQETYKGTPKPHPLDSVENVLADNNWVFNRTNKDELTVEVAGSVFNYRLCFIWQDYVNALQLICQYDCDIAPERSSEAAQTVMQVNRSTWMGHFELTENKNTPCFRYMCLLHDRNGDNIYTHVEDIINICFAQCERYQNVFQLLSSEQQMNMQMLSLAMMETAGES